MFKKFKIKPETRQKIRVKVLAAKEKAKRALPWLVWGGTTMFVVKGCVDGIEANRELQKHRSWANNEVIPVIEEQQTRLTDLERQVNKLYEHALSETAGTAEEVPNEEAE